MISLGDHQLAVPARHPPAREPSGWDVCIMIRDGIVPPSRHRWLDGTQTAWAFAVCARHRARGAGCRSGRSAIISDAHSRLCSCQAWCSLVDGRVHRVSRPGTPLGPAPGTQLESGESRANPLIAIGSTSTSTVARCVQASNCKGSLLSGGLARICGASHAGTGNKQFQSGDRFGDRDNGSIPKSRETGAIAQRCEVLQRSALCESAEIMKWARGAWPDTARAHPERHQRSVRHIARERQTSSVSPSSRPRLPV
jgi:hypothetical protein